MRLDRRLVVAICLALALLGLQIPSMAAADSADETWDPTLPRVSSAGAPGDPVAIANASSRASAMAAQTTVELGRSFLRSLGGVGGADAGVAPTSVSRVSGSQAIEYVIRRAAPRSGFPTRGEAAALLGLAAVLTRVPAPSVSIVRA